MTSGASVPDQALVPTASSPQAVSTEGFDPSRSAVRDRLPTDFQMGWCGNFLTLAATCDTSHQLDAVIEALVLMRRTLPSTREMVAGDFGEAPIERPFADRIAEFLG